jgi:hypothetical protein
LYNRITSLGETLRRVGEHHGFSIGQRHAFRADRRRDDRQAVTHAVSDFPFHAGAEPKRRDKDGGCSRSAASRPARIPAAELKATPALSRARAYCCQ